MKLRLNLRVRHMTLHWSGTNTGGAPAGCEGPVGATGGRSTGRGWGGVAIVMQWHTEGGGQALQCGYMHFMRW